MSWKNLRKIASKRKLDILMLVLLSIYFIVNNSYETREKPVPTIQKLNLFLYLNAYRTYFLKQNQGLNPHFERLQPTKYLINNQEICTIPERNQHNLILFLINSHSNNFLKRKTMRDTWLRFNKFKVSDFLDEKEQESLSIKLKRASINEMMNIKHVFLVGKGENENIQQKLESEANEFSDMIMIDSNENYTNIVQKHFALIEWSIDYCANVSYAIKLDDDVFVNINLLLRNILVNEELSPYEKFTYCNNVENAKPIKDKESKWRVDDLLYPYEFYPPFCEGFAYITNIQTLKTIKKQSQIIPMFNLDNMYLTGMLLFGLDDVKRVDFYNSGKKNSIRIDFMYLDSPYVFNRFKSNIFSNLLFSLSHFTVFNYQKSMINENETFLKSEIQSKESFFEKENCVNINNGVLHYFYSNDEIQKCFKHLKDYYDFYFYKYCLELWVLLDA